MSTAPTARRPSSRLRTTDRKGGLCFPRTGATRRKRWTSCASSRGTIRAYRKREGWGGFGRPGFRAFAQRPAAPRSTGGGAFGKNRKIRRKSEKIFPKGLHFRDLPVIITKRDCDRYAMKREVAAHRGRFFRGVCPILNRAKIVVFLIQVYIFIYKFVLKIILLFYPGRT